MAASRASGVSVVVASSFIAPGIAADRRPRVGECTLQCNAVGKNAF
jgi:hypothetical protein